MRTLLASEDAGFVSYSYRSGGQVLSATFITFFSLTSNLEGFRCFNQAHYLVRFRTEVASGDSTTSESRLRDFEGWSRQTRS